MPGAGWPTPCVRSAPARRPVTLVCSPPASAGGDRAGGVPPRRPATGVRVDRRCRSCGASKAPDRRWWMAEPSTDSDATGEGASLSPYRGTPVVNRLWSYAGGRPGGDTTRDHSDGTGPSGRIEHSAAVLHGYRFARDLSSKRWAKATEGIAGATRYVPLPGVGVRPGCGCDSVFWCGRLCVLGRFVRRVSSDRGTVSVSA